MELRHLRYFIKAAELQHFTKAAESLYISQPTLSIHIQQLEEEFGTQLFSRVGRQVRLTEAGELLLARSRRAVNELETAEEELNAIKGLLKGKLSVASLPAHGSRIMPSIISAFNAIHPDVRIQARTDSTYGLELGILSGTIDVALSLLPVEHDEINAVELIVADIVLVVSNKHPLAKKGQLEASDLHRLPMALNSNRIFAHHKHRTEYFAALGVEPKIVVEYDDGNALVEIVRLGELATLLPALVVKDDPGICMLSLPPPGIRAVTGALWAHLSPAAKAFVEFIKQKYANLNRTIVR